MEMAHKYHLYPTRKQDALFQSTRQLLTMSSRKMLLLRNGGCPLFLSVKELFPSLFGMMWAHLWGI
jgi:hypothetical protein